MRARNETSPQISLRGELKIERVKILHVHLATCSNKSSPPQSESALFPFANLLQSLLFQSASFRAVLGKWTGTTEFHSNSGLLLRSPFSGASIISKQLSLQPVPRPNCDRPINGQLCVCIWAALLNSGVCQYLAFTLHLSFSCCHSQSPFSWQIKIFPPVQPTSFTVPIPDLYQLKLILPTLCPPETYLPLLNIVFNHRKQFRFMPFLQSLYYFQLKRKQHVSAQTCVNLSVKLAKYNINHWRIIMKGAESN